MMTLAALDLRYPPPLDAAGETSRMVVDRNGGLLRAFTIADGRWRLTADLDGTDPLLVNMLVTYEDKRFFRHNGVDPLAMLRAAWQLAANGRIVSGGSTLTMQLARLLEPRKSRSLGAKLRQALRAIADRAAPEQAGNPQALPDARALWRQPGRRARGIARLFRQGPAKAHRCRGGAAGRPAAIARGPPSRPQTGKRHPGARPGAQSHDRGGRHFAVRRDPCHGPSRAPAAPPSAGAGAPPCR